ncbi:hypothetical protein PLEOSDRAFT_1086950 [Pleurotus ostreatus PC15]|uniref:Uncharacterized protein n=1 Tax=Pleurotus ostreatus (strain PC15) TaxID=1137138 RepID=A0A067N5J2_PLEO1|nr:hypothetical protein PLEOSDRAFT_1086950 [Pleurotus ostreatus PC15]
MSSSTTPSKPPITSYHSAVSDSTVVDESGARSSLPALPKGAAMPAVLPGVYGGSRLLDTSNPPSRRSSNVPLSSGGAPGGNVQFTDAEKPEPRPRHPNPENFVAQDSDDVDMKSDRSDTWVPLPLRTWFWLSLVVFLAGGAIALEVALHFSNKNQGWATKGDITDSQDVMHYVYTLPPVAVAAFLVAMWTWTDIEIKKMQPYVDLVHGDSPPQRSLLLDYTRYNNFIVWAHAVSNKHYLVMITSFMVLLSLSFQPLAAALLVVKDTWMTEPDSTVNNLALLGLNQNDEFGNLTTFVTAAGFAAASILYNLPEPPFVHGAYTIAPFEIPRNSIGNGTVVTNTTAVKSESGCRPIQIQMVQLADGSGWNNSVNSNGCTFTWSVDRNATTLFGVDNPNCEGQTEPQFAPVIFWFFTYQPTAMASGTICSPSFSLFDVNVNVDIASQNLTQVTELRPFNAASSNFSDFAGNVTGPPLNGRAYNGIEFAFALDNPDRFIRQRRDSVRLQMPAAVLQAASQSAEGLESSFQADRFVQLSTRVYTTYLTLIAKEVYFLGYPNDRRPINVQVKQWVKRLFLSDVSVHVLATFMLLLAFLSTFIQIWHRFSRRNLRLRHEPGTIASAVAIGGQTSAGELLSGQRSEKDLSNVLRGKKFRIEPLTMKIIMEGEDGYEDASSPGLRRRSVFHGFQQGLWLKDNGEEMERGEGLGGLGRSISKRISTMGARMPTSPKSPKSPQA